MTKLYYDCPIEAAYMAKYHGVKFDAEIPISFDEGYINYVQNNTYTTLSYYQEHVQDELYIAPESMEIFEPKVGDFIYKGWDDCKGNPHWITPQTIEDDLSTQLPVKIVERNNKPFIMPKEEK
jgi:hypothetical protein